MKSVEPAVYLIAETRLIPGALTDYLAAIGAPTWQTDAVSDAETLVEVAGRLCYRSFAPGLNPNVSKVRERNSAYLMNVIEQKHGSVLEHASCTFLFHHVSRVFTHELVRHRVGVAISQESLRYVRLDELKFWLPDAFQHDPEVIDRGTALVQAMESFQVWLAEHFQLDAPDASFGIKKILTSAMRRFAPLGLATSILWTANLRTLRHVIETRTAPGAEEEIRLVFDRVAQLVTERYPAVFGDFTRQEDGTWTPTTSKV